MKSYDHKKIEKKWQAVWDKKKPWKADFPSKKKKFYGLIEFPYPSGEGLHVGHVRSNTAMDIIAHKRRAEGYNVLYPIGWDAFGLPAENYAIKTGVHPAITTKKNIATFRKQLKNLGMFFDWSREVDTTDPAYYKWTQWIFLQFFKKGLAYKSKASINWCPSCKIGLANEEVIDGKCERCGRVTEKREKEQWMLAITKYAERLHKDLDLVDYLPQVKTQQRNWIGKSEGSEIDFKLSTNNQDKIKVFTTRADTLFGATYLVLSPEHQFIKDNLNNISNKDEVIKYIEQTKKKTEIERTDETREKTGVEIKGIRAINPANKEEIPVFTADYVLANYGTGAIMAVPAHDERDFAFAKKYKLPIKEVVIPNRIDEKNPPISGKQTVERRNVHVIVRNPKNNKYLLLKWKKHPWITFPMGGIESGENVIEAAKREVEEETGFTNLKYIKTLGGEVRAEYFAAHKDQNRVAFTTAVVFELIDETQKEVSEEEKDAYDIIWLSKEEIVYPKVVHAELNDWLSRFDNDDYIFTGNGILTNSGEFTNLDSESVKNSITKFVSGKTTTKFKLRDWVFSRQRYWGEPIPIINCDKCGFIPVPEKDLPVLLPKTKNYKPTDNGESPLAGMEKWIKVKCPNCKGPARRETDVMPNWAGSSWYFLRYTDPKNKKEFANKKNLKYFTPIDWYNGGMEHTTLHLLYSRFWHKFLYDLKLTPTKEPYQKRTSHGIILAEGGVKMSKSKGNVINPDTIVAKVGADSLRLYEMFMGPFDQAIGWSTDSLVGCRRFIERVWRLQEKVDKNTKLNKNQETLMHQTIKKVSEDIESMKFNTAVSTLMQYNNELEKEPTISKESYITLVRLIAPFTPHLGEELWQILKQKGSIHTSPWPKWNKKKTVSAENLVTVSVNGKMRATISLTNGISEDEAVNLAKKIPQLQKWIAGKDIKRVVYIAGKIINFVII
jgi:leucyl-tRNA synthetase